MEALVVIRTNYFIEKKSTWERFWMRTFPSKYFFVKEVEFSNGDNLGIVAVADGIKLKSILKKLIEESKKANSICIFDESFTEEVDKLLVEPGFYVVQNVEVNTDAKHLLNEIFADKLVSKAISMISNKKKINFGISIENKCQVNEKLINIIAKTADFLTIHTKNKIESLDEYLQFFSREYGLETLVSIDDVNALNECDIILGFDLNKITKVKRDAVVVDIYDTFTNKRRRKLINGFKFDMLIQPMADKVGGDLFDLLRQKIGIETLILFLSANEASPKFCEYFYHYWIRDDDKKLVAKNSDFSVDIASGFAKLGFVIYTII